MEIRENAFANLHGHTVGGTNPTLLEALAATQVNLLIDVPFNREVAQNAALYWTGEQGSLARLIDRTDDPAQTDEDARRDLTQKARNRILSAYTWEKIAGRYGELWRELEQGR